MTPVQEPNEGATLELMFYQYTAGPASDAAGGLGLCTCQAGALDRYNMGTRTRWRCLRALRC